MLRLNSDFVIVSLSHAKSRSIEKRALEAGADAHFRSPVDISELQLVLADTLRQQTKDAEPEQMRRKSYESSRFQDFVGSSESMRAVYDTIQQVADRSINVLIRGESGKGAFKSGACMRDFDLAVESALSSGHVQLILDLEAMPVIDSSGIGAVVNALRRSKQAGGDTKLVYPLPFAEKTFKMVGILKLFSVYSTEAEAVAACGE